MLKIVLTGPESSGKTTLAKALAEHYQTVWVPEYARTYLENLDRDYEEADLLKIAKGQLQLEEQMIPQANKLLFCDTSQLVLKVWSEVKYGTCHPWILEQLKQRTYDCYILCGIDIPWEYDPQREHPKYRQELYAQYQKNVNDLNLPYIEVAGTPSHRTQMAIKRIDQLLKTV